VGITKKRQAPVTVPKRDKVSPHLRLLRRDHDRLFDAFEVAHSHVNRRILELEIPGQRRVFITLFGGRMATCRACAAVGNAGDRIPRQRIP
jgi:hypothetical protein